MKKNTSTSYSSKSSTKREQRKHEVAAQKTKKKIYKGIGIALAVCVCLFVIYLIADEIIYRTNRTTPNSDYSSMLTEDGKLDGIEVNDYVVDKNFENMVVPAEELAYSDEDLQTELEKLTKDNPNLDTDSSLTVEDGSEISLDYTGYIDGVAFENGSTNGNSEKVVIGSGSYIEGFEEQLIGAHPGETVTVNVTYPDDYSNNADLAGKDATFEVVVNGIYYTPEFDDAFVQAHLSEYADTAEEYKDYLRQQHYQENLEAYVKTYIEDHAKLRSYPKSYVNQLKSLQRYADETTYASYNSYYAQLTGANMYKDFSDYTNMSDKAYEKQLRKNARRTAAANLTYQYLFDKYNLTVSDETYAAVLEDYGDNAETRYGKGYLMQAAMKREVVSYLASVVTVK